MLNMVFIVLSIKKFEKENPKKLTNKQKNQVELVKNNIKIKLEKKKCEALL